jgi:hypothetical protein
VALAKIRTGSRAAFPAASASSSLAAGGARGEREGGGRRAGAQRGASSLQPAERDLEENEL